MSRLNALRETRANRPKRHISVASQDTTASGIADSTISIGDSVRLSQFPNPPASIPGSPIPSLSTPKPNTPRVSRRPIVSPPLLAPGPRQVSILYPSSPLAPPLPGSSGQPTRPPSPSRTLSPYDWHDGASSIDVDAAEDRLLSASFITSLLREGPGSNHPHRRPSIASEAFSGISEMTYPPTNIQQLPNYAQTCVAQTSHRLPLPSQREQPTRPPPSPFVPDHIHSSSLGTNDTDTVYSGKGVSQPTTVRAASVTRGIRVSGASVVGIAPATLHSLHGPGTASNLPPTSGSADEFQGDPYEPARSQPSSSTPISNLQAKLIPNGAHRAYRGRESIRSSKSAVSSFLHKFSSPRTSMRRGFTWTKKPLPPVLLIPDIPVSEELRHRQVDESATLPELMNRADELHGMLEKGYHPHHSIGSCYSQLKPEGYATAHENHSTRGSLGPSHPSSSRDHQRPTKSPTNGWSNDLQSTETRSLLAQKKKRRYMIAVAIFIIVAIITVGATVGISMGKKSSGPVCPKNSTGAKCNLGMYSCSLE